MGPGLACLRATPRRGGRPPAGPTTSRSIGRLLGGNGRSPTGSGGGTRQPGGGSAGFGRLGPADLRLGERLREHRHSRPQRSGVGVHRLGQDTRRLTLLDHLTQVEHDDLLAQPVDDRQVVRDQQVGERCAPRAAARSARARAPGPSRRARWSARRARAAAARPPARGRSRPAGAGRPRARGEAVGVLGLEPDLAAAARSTRSPRRRAATTACARSASAIARADAHARVERRVAVLEHDLHRSPVRPQLAPARAAHDVAARRASTSPGRRGRPAARAPGRSSSCPSPTRRSARRRTARRARRARRRRRPTHGPVADDQAAHLKQRRAPPRRRTQARHRGRAARACTRAFGCAQRLRAPGRARRPRRAHDRDPVAAPRPRPGRG